jgi:hypothetical protein
MCLLRERVRVNERFLNNKAAHAVGDQHKRFVIAESAVVNVCREPLSQPGQIGIGGPYAEYVRAAAACVSHGPGVPGGEARIGDNSRGEYSPSCLAAAGKPMMNKIAASCLPRFSRSGVICGAADIGSPLRKQIHFGDARSSGHGQPGWLDISIEPDSKPHCDPGLQRIVKRRTLGITGGNAAHRNCRPSACRS